MNLHERMKQFEAVSQTYLMRRTPVIIRLDGVAFHTFTKDFDKPYDEVFGNVMGSVTHHLVDSIQGCVLGYTQSDEISLVLQDYKKLDTDAWFSYNVQKLVSVSAKMATAAFNRLFNRYISFLPGETSGRYREAILENIGFDSRCFNLPFEEVNNYLIDRQRDAERNSIDQKRGYLALPKNDPIYNDKYETPIFSKEPEFVNSRIRFNEEDNDETET